MPRVLLIALISTIPLLAHAQDPVESDGDKYKVVLENARVRILRYQDHPGDKTTRHTHPDFVLRALGPFKRRLTFPDGTTKTREFKTGDTIWMDAQSHVGENVGTTDTDAFIVELKEPRAATRREAAHGEEGDRTDRGKGWIKGGETGKATGRTKRDTPKPTGQTVGTPGQPR